MPKSKIVILEDDPTLGSALKAGFERAGFEVFCSARPNEVREYVENNNVTTLFVDCVLPTESGVDFVDEIRKKFPPAALDVVMMSGILIDPAVTKETLRSTKAIAFLKKPFEIEEALEHVKVKAGAGGVEESSPRKAFYLLLNKAKVSVREKRKAIEALEELHGFDLPYLYSLLVETMASGHLNVATQKGEVFGVSFSDGKIIGVDIADKDTQLGKLLIEGGFIHPEDLKEALNLTNTKKLGERLLSGNLVSPHAFDSALASQMSIRLSRTIVDMPVKINLIEVDLPLSNPHIDSDAFSVFLHDWIAAKISLKWLKAHYVQWGNYSLAKSANYSDDSSVLKMPLIKHFAGFVEFFTNGQTLNQLLEYRKFPEDTAFKALHLLLAKGLLVFSEMPIQALDPVEKLKVLRRLQTQLANKNKLEVWDRLVAMAGGSDSEPQFVISEFKKILGNPPSEGETEAIRIYNELKKIVDDSLGFSQSGNRAQLKEEIAKQELEKKIKAANLAEEAKTALGKSQHSMALKFLNQALAIDPGIEKLKLYMIWARLGLADMQPNKDQILRELEIEFLQIPTEERYEAIYPFVMGLFLKAKGDLAAAKKSFEKAYNLDGSLLAARREIAAIGARAQQKKDPLNRDLKDLVSGFFGKKK